MRNSPKSKPQEQASDWEEVLRWDQERIIHEEACEEVYQKQELLIKDGAEFLMTVQEIPVPEALFTLAAKPIVLSNTEVSHSKHAGSYSRNIAK